MKKIKNFSTQDTKSTQEVVSSCSGYVRVVSCCSWIKGLNL